MAALKLAASAFAYLCVATVLATGVGAAILIATNRVDTSKAYSILAIVYGIDEDKIREQMDEESQPEKDNEEPDMQAVIDARARRHLALDFRIQALDTGIENIRGMQANLAEERRRYDQLKTSFDERLKKLEEGVRDDAIVELQRTMEAIDARQAKEQMMIMLERDDNSMQDVVTILKGMPNDKRKKIIAEFRTEEEKQKLADILNQIRLGVPEATLIKDARDQLDKFQPEET
ncbi:hypothetical protein LOC68_21760 [Blastopirellula sp. JC732]|uniref:Magnesium transporter MgtE intracellular domain-containing protein n=1 Tax=Blastopirellula sediminis TaxID=2894196 RepID=A0A9X1MQG7_9BACT|nr:hypothetical protein [Blastopirellula sediminis]MCC9605674.1 hypothetical protein [Blastopirellula sediminis]MCC9631026.1 hypothetical protein [Blastopirellula sediminis]